MAISPLAEIWQSSMRQTCTVYKYTGTDYTGQPEFGTGTEYPCRIAIRTERGVSDTGDTITNSTVTLVLPASCDIEAYDQIDLPEGYQHGAVIREVVTGTDQWGGITHKAVRIV